VWGVAIDNKLATEHQDAAGQQKRSKKRVALLWGNSSRAILKQCVCRALGRRAHALEHVHPSRAITCKVALGMKPFAREITSATTAATAIPPGSTRRCLPSPRPRGTTSIFEAS